MKNKSGILLILLFVSAVSCLPISGSGGRGKGKKGSGIPTKYIETFFRGAGKTMYFVKPLPWKETTTGDDLELDFTYDFNPDSMGRPVIARFTFHSDKPVTPVQKAEFILGGESFACDHLDKVFVEPGEKGGYANRYECALTFELFTAIASTESPVFSITHKGGTGTYKVTRKWDKKVAAYVQTHIIEMVHLELEDN